MLMRGLQTRASGEVALPTVAVGVQTAPAAGHPVSPPARA